MWGACKCVSTYVVLKIRKLNLSKVQLHSAEMDSSDDEAVCLKSAETSKRKKAKRVLESDDESEDDANVSLYMFFFFSRVCVEAAPAVRSCRHTQYTSFVRP